MKANTTNTFFLLAFFFIVSFSGVSAQENTTNDNNVDLDVKKEMVVATENAEASIQTLSFVSKTKASFEIAPMSKKEVLFLSGNSTKTSLLRTIHRKASRYTIAVA